MDQTGGQALKVAICGAGVNGIACALHLRRAGVDVTLIDRAEPASGTSYGNAGVLASGAVIPVSVPGLAVKAPRMLVDPASPLFLRWGYLPKLAPFLLRFLSHGTAAGVDRYAKAMTLLLHDSVAQHQALARGTSGAEFIGDEDYCFAYESEKAFEADGWAWALRGRLGHRFTILSGADFAKQEPLYRDRFHTLVQCHDHGRISDPGRYLRSLFDAFVALGGTFLKASVTGLKAAGMGRKRAREGLGGLLTTAGLVEADRYVFTLGPWSGTIAKELGLKVPFEAEGGYHFELINPSHMPRQPVMVASGKFVITPMAGRLRLAGVVDFSGLDAPDNEAALALLKRQASELLAHVTYERTDSWHGFRPTTANALPLIGQVDAIPNAYVGFGHQHVGLTGGAKTGAILAGLVRGLDPTIDLSAFNPNAYA